MDTGISTGKQRENLQTQENNSALLSMVYDLLKQIDPGQKARVISFDKDKGLYRVELQDDKRIAEAMLGKTKEYFNNHGNLVAEDIVYVTHKKDSSYCIIQDKCDPFSDLELNKRLAVAGGYEFRFDNTKYNNENQVTSIYENFCNFFSGREKFTHVQPAVKG
jgi:hypothetical protein